MADLLSAKMPNQTRSRGRGNPNLHTEKKFRIAKDIDSSIYIAILQAHVKKKRTQRTCAKSERQKSSQNERTNLHV